jgi:hypothetical protein
MLQLGYSTLRGLKVGVVGGLVGSVVLGLLAALGSLTMGQEVFYVTIGRKLGLSGASVVGGWILHFIVGLVAGAVFVGVTAQVKQLALTTTRRGLWVGVLAGIALWVFVYVPVTGVLVPTDLTDPAFAVGSFVLHMLYGVVTAIVSLSLLRRGLKTSRNA